MWFEQLTGFPETGADSVRSQLVLDGEQLVSKANGRSMRVGRLTKPSLAELRAAGDDTGPGSLTEVVADAQQLHRDPANNGAVFQVASQFNLLEMVHEDVSPLDGVDGYEQDHTQGPACAIACGAATIYRNYLAPVGGGIGQTDQRQIDCLADLGAALGNAGGELWEIRNGYCLPNPEGLDSISSQLGAASETELDELRGLLRIGVHADVEVTLGDSGNTVTQIFGSALPVAYRPSIPASAWEPFARLVLEASYEATLRVAHTQAGDAPVFLTLLGGGAFGNADEWIEDAVMRAVSMVGAGLDLRMVSYGRPNKSVRRIIDRLGA